MVIHKALTVVVIDDNQHLRSSLEQLLVLLGHAVYAAATGEDGLRLARYWRPDLVICDICLEGPLNGYGVAREIRQHDDTVNTFLVALSGNSQQQDRERSARAGFDLHLAKPAALTDIEALIDSTRLHRMRRGRQVVV